MSTATTDPGLNNGAVGAVAPAAQAKPRLLLRPSPHIHSTLTVPVAMRDVLISLMPAAAASVYLFGWPALTVLIACVAASLVAEVVCLRLRGRQMAVHEGSAAVTGLLLALTLPPHSPVWMCIIGSFVAIGLGKHVFGGLGANPFNPALVARIFLLISFPDLMTTWVMPFDAATSATPLVTYGAAKSVVSGGYLTYILGTHAGSLGETSTVALLVGALYLLARNIIDWRVPAAILATSGLIALAAGVDPIFHMMSGGLVLGAFFMATDWVTSPITRRGRVIYGIGIGFVTMAIRLWGNFPEGVSFAILFMNLTTPLLNEFTRPKPQTVSVKPKERSKEGAGALVKILVSMAVVAAVSGAVLALFYGAMNPRIQARRQQEMEAGFRAIFPAAVTFQPIDLAGKMPKRVSNVYRALDAQGAEVGIAYMATPSGFQGDITLAVGINRPQNAIAGVRVLAHTETAGLGSKVEGSAYLDQYLGKFINDEFIVKKDVDGISGATISSAAVANGVRDSARGVMAAVADAGM